MKDVVSEGDKVVDRLGRETIVSLGSSLSCYSR